MTRVIRVCRAIVLAVGLGGSAHHLRACATCFGASDAPMAQGMNMGILSLLLVVGVVLSLFGAFFVFLARRSARTPMPHAPAMPVSTPK